MQVDLYTKPGCHLCDLTKADLLGMQPKIGFVLTVHNILDDPDLHRRLRYVIPVVDIEYGPALYAPVDFLALQAALVAAKKVEQTHAPATGDAS